LVVVDDTRDFRVSLVLKNGQIVAEDGAIVTDIAPPRLEHVNSVHVAPVEQSAFALRLSGATCPVIRIIPDQLITQREMQTVRCEKGLWAFDAERDVALVASIERHAATGNIGLGLVSGFGLRRHGALASSVAHDSHNLIVVGTNPHDMLACVRALEESGGGFVVAADGAIQASLPLAIAGLISTERASIVCGQLEHVNGAARALGCMLKAPFGALSFLALPVIPELRITDQGLFDVTRQEFISL
jgi:adenine deaminase